MSARRRRHRRQNEQKNIFLRLEEERQANRPRGLNFRRRRRGVGRTEIKKYALPVLWMAALILLAFLLVRAFAVGIDMAGSSMTDTIQPGDHILVDRVTYRLSHPKAQDVIVFLPPNNQNAQYSVKRIVAGPSDTVLIKNGSLYVNGSKYEVSAASGSLSDAGLAAEEITLGDDEYFVLGDNRSNSEDSRYETIGNIRADEIIGKIWFDTTRANFGPVR